MRAAVIDVGSNSVRLLLAEGIDATGVLGERVVTVTGLRRGADADGRVTDSALARLDACLVDYAARIVSFGATGVVPVGTAAVREAPNVADIAQIVRHRLAPDLIVIPGEREAALAFAGARLVLFGGAAMDGERHISWNFVASDRALIDEARERWRSRRFEPVPGETEFIPLPEH